MEATQEREHICADWRVLCEGQSALFGGAVGICWEVRPPHLGGSSIGRLHQQHLRTGDIQQQRGGEKAQANQLHKTLDTQARSRQVAQQENRIPHGYAQSQQNIASNCYDAREQRRHLADGGLTKVKPPNTRKASLLQRNLIDI